VKRRVNLTRKTVRVNPSVGVNPKELGRLGGVQAR